MVKEWESLNAKAELARMHRVRHCHETMVWYRPLHDVVACSPTLEESYRRATTQEPIIEGGSLVSLGLASQRDRFPNCQAGPTALSTPLFSDAARCRGVGTPSWAGPLTTSLRGLWVSGYLPRAMADREQGRRPENRPCGDDSVPGMPARRERGLNCHRTEYSRTSVDCINAKMGGGPKDPTVRREGTREPRRRGAICCCGLSRQPQVRRVWTVTFDSLFRDRPKDAGASSQHHSTSVAADLSDTTLRRRVLPFLAR